MGRALLLAVALLCGIAQAAGVTVTGVSAQTITVSGTRCDFLAWFWRGDDLIARCGDGTVFLTVAGIRSACRAVNIVRNGAAYTVRCS